LFQNSFFDDSIRSLYLKAVIKFDDIDISYFDDCLKSLLILPRAIHVNKFINNHRKNLKKSRIRILSFHSHLIAKAVLYSLNMISHIFNICI